MWARHLNPTLRVGRPAESTTHSLGTSPTFKAPLSHLSWTCVQKVCKPNSGRISDGTYTAERETLLDKESKPTAENPSKPIKTQPNMDGNLTTNKDSFRPCRPPTSAMKKLGPFVSRGKSKFSHCAFQLMALDAKCLKKT